MTTHVLPSVLPPRAVPLPAARRAEPPPEPRAWFGLAGRTWLRIAAFWTTMALLETVRDFVLSELDGRYRIPAYWWAKAFAGNLPWWYGWLLLTPLVFALARRYPPWRPGGTRYAALHFAAAFPLTLAHCAAGGALWWTIARGTQAQPPGAAVQRIVTTYLISDLMVYWALVGAYAAFDYHRRFRDRELEAARLAVRAAQLETSVTEARLSALRMELNPHFLFNSLNSVSGLVRRRENEQAVRVLATLGELLRTTLGQKEQEVPLELELDFLRRYLEIERVRYHDRLTVEEDVPSALLSVPVPSLVLQPLVENAVRHGIARTRGPGTVTIRAARDGGQVVLEVRDTGAGVEAARRNGTRGHGVGLKNTRERLAQLYGDRASLTLESAPGGGTRAVVRLPVPPEEDYAAER